MRPRQALGERDTDRAHGKMNRALAQLRGETSLSQGDGGRGVIIRQHRDHRVTVAHTGKIGCLVGAELDERAAFTRSAVEYCYVVAALYEIGRHRRAHLSESNESKFHSIVSLDRAVHPPGLLPGLGPLKDGLGPLAVTSKAA